MSVKVLTLLVSLAFCLAPRLATALCQQCASQQVSFLFEQQGYQETANDISSRIAQLNALIQPLQDSYNNLTYQIANTEDEDEKQSLQEQRDDVLSQLGPPSAERDELQTELDQLNLSLAGLSAVLEGYNSPCEHEALCPQCGNTVATCFCDIFTCDFCNHIITQCTCNVYPCPQCGFDSQYCGHNNPPEENPPENP
jgi:hypothetical protein